jgi:predicted transposase/invertase (TIGR01784 family)
MTKILNPHDKFFRGSMKDIRIAREFFDFHLPEKFRGMVDLSSLKLCNGSFVDARHCQRFTDILYSVLLQEQQAYLFLLVEHQSTPDELMAFRLLTYLCRIMQEHIDQTQSKVLPIVVPMVFYHGKESYPYSSDLFDLFGEHKSLAKNIFLQPFHLIDIGAIPDEELRKRQWAGLMEFTMKHVFARDVLPLIQQIMPQLQHIDKLGENDYIMRIIDYLMTVGDIHDSEAFIEVVTQNLSPQMGAEIMTFAERLRQEGKQEGRQEGIEQGLQKGKEEGIKAIASKLLQKEDMPLSAIAELTGLTLEQLNVLKKEKGTQH